jgi:4-hydroxy-4-methyl-2-oxoglutarate aldolase
MKSPSSRITMTPATSGDLELFALIESSLYTAAVCDSLDHLGYRHQAMREFIRPLFQSCCFAGWARTILCADVYHTPSDPYRLEIEALDSVLPGEVVIVSSAGSIQNAPWGELLSTAAQARGGKGAVIDGLVRDVRKIEALGFPVFARGVKPVDSMGRGMVIDYNIPIESGGVLVSPGDLIFADFDGVVAIPPKVVSDTIRLASEKAAKENSSRQELKAGGYLRDVFNKYGVL